MRERYGFPLVKYLFVGVFNTIFYMAILYSLLKYTLYPEFISVAIAFLICMFFQYSANRIFTFRSKQSISIEIPKYICSAIINYLIGVVVVVLTRNVFELSDLLCSVISSVVLALSGFVISLLWVYRRVD
ncbi:TPA: GtrA family protein [Yersinia enterocolitica]|uniref:GtrA family protein n=1 Tax=Yersinia enterocolitica TaxID=630 RepID=UPI002AC7035F|nr:GtrA family protein [Yersinia enterocolitica]HEN3597271.1 GtrA family protein [Yersinia enterocolitica]